MPRSTRPFRRTRSLRATGGLAALAALTTLAACGDDPFTADPDTIAGRVLATPELSTMADALEAGGVLPALDMPGSLTLFAPTNEAFEVFLSSQGYDADALMDLPALGAMMRYHVSDPERSVAELTATTTVVTIEGRAIEITADLDGLLLNDEVRLTSTPIEASNGVIHQLDAVLARPTTTSYRREPRLPLADITTDSIEITEQGFVRGLEVYLDIDHSLIYYLGVALLNEATGEQIELVRWAPTYNDDIKATLTDRADLDVIDDVVWGFEEEPAYTAARYRPLEPLRFAYGQPMAGRWTLVVDDVSFEFSGWLNEWGLDVTSTEERPDPTLAVARPRGASGVIGAGFAETLPVRIKRLAGLTGPVQVTLDAGDGVTTSPTTLTGTSETAVLAFQAATDAVPGSRTLRVDATAGRAHRSVALPGVVVTPDAAGVELQAQVPLAELGTPAGSGNDIWGWTDPTTAREYALMGTSHGTAFVDVTTPAAPRYLGFLPTHTEDSLWRDIKVYRDHAFVVSEATGHGLQVFDLTRLRGVTTPQTFTESAHYAGFGNAHNFVIDEATGFGYAVGTSEGPSLTCGAGGLFIVDLAVPLQPGYVGCFAGGVPAGATPGPAFPDMKYTHDAQCVVYQGPDVDHQGHEICVTSDGDSDGLGNSVGIVDVTLKAAPTQLARVGYVGSGYTHQGWLTEDHAYFLLGDEFDEFDGVNTRTYIFDVRDLDAPVLAGFFDNPRDAVGHNMYSHDGRLYQANYTSGLRIVDLADVATGGLAEVAYFDTHPEDDTFDDGNPRCRLPDRARARRPGAAEALPHPSGPRTCGVATYAGAWSNYPYFASGTIIISDMQRGLFVVRRTPE